MILYTSKNNDIFINELSEISFMAINWRPGKNNHYLIKKAKSDVSKESYKNIVIFLHPSFFHFLNDSVASIFYYNDIYSNVKFYLDVSLFNESSIYNNGMSFLKNILNKTSINYEIVDLSTNTLLIKNFLIVDNFYEISFDRLKSLYHALEQHGYLYSGIPYKKIYISTANNYPNSIDISKFHLNEKIVNNNQPLKRIKDEKKIEDYFKNKNFEIISPNMLLSIEEQIYLFSQAKLVVGVTSGSLSNTIFMPPFSTLLEISAPMANIFHDNNWSMNIDSSYKNLAFAKNLVYLSIPIDERFNTAIDIIEKCTKIIDGISVD